jgi:hypothetical protein
MTPLAEPRVFDIPVKLLYYWTRRTINWEVFYIIDPSRSIQPLHIWHNAYARIAVYCILLC